MFSPFCKVTKEYSMYIKIYLGIFHLLFFGINSVCLCVNGAVLERLLQRAARGFCLK
jgi:hypothetical protein